MNSNTAVSVLGTVRLPFYTPVPKALAAVQREFERGARVVQVLGFPLKIFCVRDAADNVALLRDKEVGEIKLPALLPRVKQVMRDGGYIQPGGPIWRDRRRQVQEGFRSDYLRHYVAQLPAIVERTLEQWASLGPAGGTVDISHAMRDLVTAANLKVFFSFEPNARQLSDIAEWTHFIEHRLVGVIPLWVPTPTNLKFNAYARRLRDTFSDMVKRRAQLPEGEQPKDLLTVLLKAKHGDSGAAWTTDDIVDEAFSVFFGASVVAVTIAWGLHRLAFEAATQADLRASITEFLAEQAGDYTTLVNCPAADMLVKETLRLYPASWGYPRHCRQGMQIAGVSIPAGAVVIPMIQLAHMRTSTWQEPEKFCPHRFDSPEGSAAVSSHAYLPFGMGSRTCLGANFAPMMIKLVLGMLLHRYSFGTTASQQGLVPIDYGFEIQPLAPLALHVKALGS